MTAIMWIGLVITVCAVLVGIGLHNAPQGYEDEKGFHYLEDE